MTESVSLHAPTPVRCSDADRERTSARLRDAAGEGRLAMDELEDRLSGVYAARYAHELDALVTDPPRPAGPAVAGAGWRVVLAALWTQLGADLSLLLGRGGAGWTRRRLVICRDRGGVPHRSGRLGLPRLRRRRRRAPRL